MLEGNCLPSNGEMKSYQVEKKAFIFENLKEKITILERGRGFTTKLDLQMEEAMWLYWRLKNLSGRALRLGTYGSKIFADLDLVISIKAN